jgi:hypothetical protein
VNFWYLHHSTIIAVIQQKRAAHRPPNIFIVPQQAHICPSAFSPRFGIISYGTSHLAKQHFFVYYKDTKKE